MKIGFLAAILPGALLFGGCAISPHRSIQTSEIHGRIMDADTQKPVTGARIAWKEKPSIATRTDATGAFDLPATHRLHWLQESSDRQITRPPEFSTLILSEPDYKPLELDAYKFLTAFSPRRSVYVQRQTREAAAAVVRGGPQSE
jgi:hypothetical protein